MSTSHEPTESQPDDETRTTWLEYLADNRKLSASALIVAGIMLAIIPAWLGYKYGKTYLELCLTTGILALVPLAAGGWYLLIEPERNAEIDVVRMLALTVGVSFGLILVLVSCTLIYHWWKEFVSQAFKTLQSPDDRWRIWLIVGVFLGGLACMFFSLHLGRSTERSSAMLRRLVYGYEAVFTGLLLLVILAVLNVASNMVFPTPIDWTQQGMYTLSERSENILKNLQKQTKVYVILGGEDLRRSVRALLDNCLEIQNKKLEVKYLSPDRDREEIKHLAEKYPISERQGLVVVSGVPPREDNIFISAGVLFKSTQGANLQHRDNRFFNGESELMTAISFLEENKQKTVIYFTQGNGELSLDDSSTQQPNVGAAALKGRLEAENYVVKGLQFSKLAGTRGKGPDTVVSMRVPKDAALVVVGGPRSAFASHAIEALHDYMDLRLVLTAPEMLMKSGEKFSYQIELANQGTRPRGKVEIVAQLPSQVRLVKAAGDGGVEPQVEGRRISFPLVNLLSERKTLKHVIEVEAREAGDARLQVEVRSCRMSPEGKPEEEKDRNPLVDEVSTKIYSGAPPEEAETPPKAKEEPRTKGKLLILFDLVFDAKKQILKTGLEDLVASYNVQVGDDRILYFQGPRELPTVLIPARINPSEDLKKRNKIAAVFPEDEGFAFYNTRTVKPNAEARPGPSLYQVDSLLLVPKELPAWAETNMNLGIDQLLTNQQLQGIAAKVHKDDISIACVVSEAVIGPTPDDSPEAKPRLAVFGCSTPISNLGVLNSKSFGRQLDLVQSVLGWMRERRGIISILPKQPDVYTVQTGVDFSRMHLLPVFLMMVGILSLGTGVWVVRRR